MATCGSHHSVLNEVLAFRLCEEDNDMVNCSYINFASRFYLLLFFFKNYYFGNMLSIKENIDLTTQIFQMCQKKKDQ